MDFCELKRKVKPFLILYLIVDIVIIGTIIVVLNDLPSNSEASIIYEVVNKFIPTLTSFKFLQAIFIDFMGFLSASLYTFIGFVILFLFWLYNDYIKDEYKGIENGSSSWSTNGEEFSKLRDGSEILNKKEGFILSRKHYLGTDLKKVKINKNILVVGRFWNR